MAKQNLSSKNFFSIVVLSVAVLSIIFMSGFIKLPTSTETEAGCRVKPYMDYKGATDGTNNITYQFRVYTTSTNCKTTKYGFWYNVPNSNWGVELKKNGGSWNANKFVFGSLAKGEGDTIRMRVTPPANAAYKTYDITAWACNQQIIDRITYPGDKCVERYLKYTKTAPPSPTLYRPF